MAMDKQVRPPTFAKCGGYWFQLMDDQHPHRLPIQEDEPLLLFTTQHSVPAMDMEKYMLTPILLSEEKQLERFQPSLLP